MWTALVLGLLAAVGVFVNGSGMSTLNSADAPANSADASASSELVSLGPVTLIADFYGSASASCLFLSRAYNYAYIESAPGAWGAGYDTVTSATPGAGLAFAVGPMVFSNTGVLYMRLLAPNNDCSELATGTVIATVEGLLDDGTTYEITILAP
ncbi:MAG: hypothetical protein GY925_14485 [Actinomycetia bacterium]|nr:hypothetical protein [Actinomycetes bacterium]